MTAFEMLKSARLDAARGMLEDEPMLLKQVAHAVGYNHVTNVTNTYTRHFGAPPRQHLK